MKGRVQAGKEKGSEGSKGKGKVCRGREWEGKGGNETGGEEQGRGEGGKERSHFLFYNLSTGYLISKANG